MVADDRQLRLQFGDRQTRVKTIHYCSEDSNSRCDATLVLLVKGRQAWLCLQVKGLNEFQFSV